MRFNSAELAALCTNPTTKFEREGLLVLTERQEGFFRRADVNCLHWCKLYGNLFFYLKDHDPRSQVAGVIVLENFRPSIWNEEREFDGFVFFLEFEGSSPQRLAARTAQERQDWIKSLKVASCSYVDRQIALLREQIAIKMGNSIETGSTLANVEDENETISVDPNISARTTNNNQIKPSNNIEEDLSEVPLCECALSCERLLTSTQSRISNYRVVVAVLPRNDVLLWRDFACTEIVEGTVNPKFLCTIRFRRSDGFKSDSLVRFTVYDVREKVSAASVPLGYAEVTLGLIQDVTQFRMPIRSMSGGQCGFLTISARRPDTHESATLTSRSSIQLSKQPRKGHRRVQSLPSKLGVKLYVPCHERLQSVFANPKIQTYQMRSLSGGDISVLECLLESKLCFMLPQQLLSIWILREKELLQEISGMGELGGEWRRRQMDLLDKHLKLLDDYSQAQQNLQQLCQEPGPYFKRSTLKMDEALEFVPVNLHLQRMWVHNDTLSKKCLLDIVTVGAFARHSVAARTGGLIKLLQAHKAAPSKYTENSCKVQATSDVVQAVKQLRKEVVDIMLELLYLAKVQNPTDMMPLCNEIISKTKNLLNIWDHSLVEEAFAFVEKHRIIEEPDNALTPMSPFCKIAQQLGALDLKSPELEDFTTPSVAPPDLWPLTKTGANAGLSLESSNNIRRRRQLQSQFNLATIGRHLERQSGDSSMSKTNNEYQSLSVATNDASEILNFTRDDTAAVLASAETTAAKLILLNEAHDYDLCKLSPPADLNSSNSDPNTSAECTQVAGYKHPNCSTTLCHNISFLDTKTMNMSPSANYYRPKEEPEPLDLTQLNIEASVMCLVSKVKFLCGRCGSPAIRLRYPKCGNKFEGFQNVLGPDVLVGPSTAVSRDKDCSEESVAGIARNGEHNLASIRHTFKVENQNAYITDNGQQELPKKGNKFTEGLNLSLTNDWASELRPSMRKLRHAMDGLLKTARLMHSVQRLQQDMKRTSINLEIMYRRDVCFSQALTALTSSLMAKLWGAEVTENYISILLEVGPLAYFEGLLSMYGSEADMWGDMCVAIEDLSTISFTLVRSDLERNYSLRDVPTPQITGSRGALVVQLPVPDNLTAFMITKSNPTFKITPVFFNIGINEKATLAETLGYTRDQNRSNWNNFVRLKHYYNRLWKIQKLSTSNQQQKLKVSTLELVEKILEKIEDQLRANVSKNVKILQLAEDACRFMFGLRFTSCKSAKDRTGMAVTLEQSRLLMQEFSLPAKTLPTVLSTMRSQGTRMENVYKNINKRKYAFNLPQVMALPALYRPPAGSYGKAET